MRAGKDAGCCQLIRPEQDLGAAYEPEFRGEPVREIVELELWECDYGAQGVSEWEYVWLVFGCRVAPRPYFCRKRDAKGP